MSLSSSSIKSKGTGREFYLECRLWTETRAQCQWINIKCPNVQSRLQTENIVYKGRLTNGRPTEFIASALPRANPKQTALRTSVLYLALITPKGTPSSLVFEIHLFNTALIHFIIFSASSLRKPSDDTTGNKKKGWNSRTRCFCRWLAMAIRARNRRCFAVSILRKAGDFVGSPGPSRYAITSSW